MLEKLKSSESLKLSWDDFIVYEKRRYLRQTHLMSDDNNDFNVSDIKCIQY